MEGFWQDLWSDIGAWLPQLLAGLGILVIGWLIAWGISALVRALLHRTSLDDRFARWVAGGGEPREMAIEETISKIVFWVLMLFVIVAFFQVLNLTVVATPLNDLLAQLFAYLPRILGAAGLLLLAWIVASVLKFLVTRAIAATRIDRRIREEAALEGTRRVPISQAVGNAVYWLVFLLFLPAILDALALQGLLGPVGTMVNELLAVLPNLFGAALILVVGWFAARIVQRVVSNVLAAVGVNRFSERIGLSRVLGRQTLADLIGLIVYILILIPVVIAALDTLGLEAITQPAANMLNDILNAIPDIFAAALVLIIAYAVGRLVANLVANLLEGFGFDRLLARWGIGAVTPPATTATTTVPGEERLPEPHSPSQIVGDIILVTIMLFAAVAALNLLGFESLAALVVTFIGFAWKIILGLILFAVGLYLANLAASAVRSSRARNAGLLAWIARVAILALAGAMALRTMGLANEIINLAFGLLLGAIAVAFALAFGLGGRDVAERELEKWASAIESGEVNPPPPSGTRTPPPPTTPGPGLD